MSLALRLRTPRLADVGSMQTAMGVSTTGADVVESSYSNFIWNDRFNSQAYAERMARDKMFGPVISDLEANDAEFDRGAIYMQSQKFFNQESAALGRRAFTTDEAKYAYLQERSAEMGRTPMPPFNDFWAEANRMGAASAAEVAAKADEVSALYGGTSNAKLRIAQIAGSLPAVAQDPIILGAIIASWPVAASASILRMAAFEAAVGGATEIPIQLQRHDWYEKQGRELTAEDMAMAVALATGFSGVVGGLFGAGFKLAGGQSSEMFGAFKHGPQSSIDRILQAHKQQGIGFVPEWDGAAAYFEPAIIHPAPRQSWEGVQLEDQWVADSTSNVWNPTPATLSLDRTLLNLSSDITSPELRATVLAIGHDANLKYTSNPAFRTDSLETSAIDRMVWTHRDRVLQQKSRANVQEAIERLNKGEAPNPRDMGELSIQIKLYDDTSDRTRSALKGDVNDEVSKMLDGDKELTAGSSRVRDVVAGLLRRAYEQKMRPLIDDVADRFPEKGWYKVEGARPKYTRKQLDKRFSASNERINVLNDELETLNKARARSSQLDQKRVGAEITELRKELATATRVAEQYNRLGKVDLVGPQPRAINDIATDIDTLARSVGPETKKVDLKLERLNTRKVAEGAKQEALNPFVKELDAYAAKLLDANKVNTGLLAQRNLEELANGKIPKELNSLRDMVIKSMNEERANRYWTTPERADRPDVFALTDRKTWRTLREDQMAWDVNASDPVVVKAREAAQELRFADEATDEVKQAVDYQEVEDLETIVAAAKQCGMP